MSTIVDNQSKKTDNEIIAEFMGAVFSEKHQCWEFEKTAHTKHSLPYDTSWDWLMPVVQKCHKLQGGKWNDMTRLQFNFIYAALATLEIEAVHAQVVEFIKWYNIQKK